MQFKTYTHTDETINELANKVRQAVVDSMVREGLLSRETADEYQHTHFVSIHDKKILFPWFRKSKDTTNIYVSKLDHKLEDKADPEEKDD